MKKSLERIYAEWFIKEIGWENHEIQDSEQPDFIINFPNKKIGIEITNLYKDEGKNGSPQKTKESHNTAWLRKFANEYYKKNSIPIRLQVLVKTGNILPEPNEIINELISVIPPGNLERSEIELKTAHGMKIKLFILRLPSDFGQYKRWTFVNNHVGWSGDISLETIRKKIENKRQKAANYNQNLNQLILLIILDSSNESGMLEIPDEGLDFSCQEFDNIFLVKHLMQIKKIG